MSAGPRSAGQKRSELGSRAVQAGFVIALVGLWYIGTLRSDQPILLPNPVRVFDELVDVLATLEFVSDLRVTLFELAAAFSISATSGIVLGLSDQPLAIFDPCVRALLAGIYSVPIILFCPLHSVLRPCPASKIALGVSTSFFPDHPDTIAASAMSTASRPLRALDGRIDYQLFRWVLLPAAFPIILTGLRIASRSRFFRSWAVRRSRRCRPRHRIVHLGEGWIWPAVRLHRVRGRDRAHPQHRDLEPRGAGKAALDDEHRLSGTPRAPSRSDGDSSAGCWRAPAWPTRRDCAPLIAWEIAARFFVDKFFLSPPRSCSRNSHSVRNHRRAQCAAGVGVRDRRGVRMSVVIGLAVASRSAASLQPKSFMRSFCCSTVRRRSPSCRSFILYFGIGPASKIAFGVSHGIFPIIVTVVAGVQNIKPICSPAPIDGREPLAHLPLGDLPAHDPSFFAGMAALA